MAKYFALRDYLNRIALDTFPMTFKEIEDILGFPLPPSAGRYREWWSGESHTLSKDVLKTGFRASFNGSDFDNQKVVFRRVL